VPEGGRREERGERREEKGERREEKGRRRKARYLTGIFLLLPPFVFRRSRQATPGPTAIFVVKLYPPLLPFPYSLLH